MKYSSSVTMAVALPAASAGLHSCINEVAGVTKGLRGSRVEQKSRLAKGGVKKKKLIIIISAV